MTATSDIPISSGEILEIAHRLTARHCRRLVDTLRSSAYMDIDRISDENFAGLLDTKRLLIEWTSRQSHSDAEKRKMLQDAASTVRGNIWKSKIALVYFWSFICFTLYIITHHSVNCIKICNPILCRKTTSASLWQTWELRSASRLGS